MSRFHLLRSTLIRLFCLLAVVGSAEGYEVKRGDTLYSIARTHGVSVNKLMSQNGIRDAKSMQVGRVLTIPGKTKSSQSTKSSVSLKASNPVSRGSSKSLTVILDPGHGGRDRGAVWGGVRESDLNLKTAFKAKANLESAGYRVVMTRTSDSYVSLSRRAAIANSYRNAIFVSIHYNATRETWVGGAETFYAGSKRSRYLATSIQRNLASRCQVRNRGTHFRKFTVLRQTHCPAILVECGFISNSRERSRCNTSAFQSNAARAISDGIKRYDRSY